MKASERRQAILEKLCAKRFEQINNLAFEYGVNECTIRRDLLEFSLFYPIFTKQGNGGGVYVAEDYYLNKQYLKPSQVALLEKLSQSLVGDEAKIIKGILKVFARPNKEN